MRRQRIGIDVQRRVTARSPVFETAPRAPWLGDSGMAGLIRAFDWSATPLGPLDTWSPSLCTSLGMCLHSRFPMVVYWSSELIYLYNDANAAAIGELHPRALGRPAREMLPESWDVLEPRLRAVLERGEASWAVDEKLVFSFRERPEAGYFTYSFSPIHEPDGSVGGVLLVTQDTSARVLAERRIELLRTLAAVDDLHTVDAACEAMVAALEGSADLPRVCIHLETGRTVASRGITPAPERPVPAGLVPASTLMRGPAVPHTGVAVAFDGGVLAAALDDERIFDAEYRRLLEQVAEQVALKLAAARLNEGIRRHAEEVEELDRAKTAFFSNAAHELRAPLSLVLGSLEHAGHESGSEWLDVARRNALRMLRTINAVLDYSKLEARVHTGLFQPTDLGELSARLVAMFESAAELAGLELVNHCRSLGAPVHVDRDAWEKVVGNLLSNALKFTLEGRVVVTCELEAEHAVLTVADTGIGIAPEHLEHVFSRFHRVTDPRARAHDGTGIGLALVRELVHLHGGTIEAHSDAGTRMVVRIPRGTGHLPPDELGEPDPVAGVGSAAGLFVEDAVGWFADPTPASQADRWLSAVTAGEAPARVLVVDDNADMRAYLAQLLAPYFEVTTAQDGSTALETALALAPDVVVSDVMMPGLDGLALVRALRADARTQEVPVVLLSARPDSDRLAALRAGADDYLLKPIGARELVARVRATVQLFRARREIAEARGRLEERAGVERDLRAAHRRVVTAADAARRRIERNLHDGAQQRLIAILLRLETGPEEHAAVRARLEPIRAELERALDELRELAHGLFPPLLASDGLEAALGTAARRSGLPVTLNARAVGRLDPELEAAVYFCCVEALQNAAKHAGAGARVRVDVVRTPHELRFSVQDDGVGFDARGGYGLVNLRDRVEALGGRAEIASAPGQGTTVRGTLPLG